MNFALSPGVILNGRYRIEQEIGHGGFSITYKAVDLKDETQVAVKELYKKGLMVRNPGGDNFVVIDDSDVQELEQMKEKALQEAVILRGFLDEPYIVRVLDQFRANNTAYIVMEFLDGTELEEKVKKEGKIAPEEAFAHLIPIMQALCKVHAAQIIHRDIAPDNIMVRENGSYCLFDFGSAKMLDAGATMSLVFKEFFSPVEQKVGLPVGSWSDVYSLFATVYYMITGNEPKAAMSRMYFDELVPPSEQGIEIDKRLEEILLKGMAVDPEDRYRTFEEVLDELKSCLPEEIFEPKIERKRKKLPLRLWWAAIPAVAAVAAVIVHYYPAIRYAVEVKEKILVCPVPEHEKQFQSQKEAILGRIELLTKDVPTDIEENDKGELLVTTADRLFEQSDPEDVFSGLLSGSFKTSIGFKDEKDNMHSIMVPADIPEIRAVAEDDVTIDDAGTASLTSSTEEDDDEEGGAGYIVVTVAQPVQEMLKNLLKDHKDEELHFYYDMDFLQNPDPKNNVREGSRVYVDEDCSTWFVWTSDTDRTQEHLKSNLRAASYLNDAQARSRSDESSSSSVVQGGTYQVDPDEIKGPILKATYNPVSGTPNKGEIAMVEINMKARLDRLGRPYAITYEEHGSICVTMNIGDVSPFVLKTLFMGSSNVRVTSTWLYRIGTISPTGNSLSFVSKGNGTYEALMVLDEGTASEEGPTIKQKVEKLLRTDDAPPVYIELDGLGSDTYEGIYSHVVLAQGVPRIDDGGRCVLAFSTLCLGDGVKVPITDENRYLLNYVGSLHRGTDYSNVLYRLDHVRCFDEKGNPTSDDLGPCEAFIPNYRKEIRKAVTDTGIRSRIVCDMTGAVTVEFDKTLTLSEAVSNIETIYKACHFEDGRMRGVYFRAKNLTVSMDKTTETYDGYALTVTAAAENGTADTEMQKQLGRKLSTLPGIRRGNAASGKK